MHQAAANSIIHDTLENNRSTWPLVRPFFFKWLYTLHSINILFCLFYLFVCLFLVPAKKASGHSKATTTFFCRALGLQLKASGYSWKHQCGRNSHRRFQAARLWKERGAAWTETLHQGLCRKSTGASGTVVWGRGVSTGGESDSAVFNWVIFLLPLFLVLRSHLVHGSLILVYWFCPFKIFLSISCFPK